MTVFFEGEPVVWVGGGFKAEGHIVAVGTNSAHVKWSTGPSATAMTFVDLFDIEKVGTAQVPDDPMHLVAVRRAYDADREVGVLNFLASNSYLDSWTKIAQDVVAYTEDRIKKDASMDLPFEQLSSAEMNSVVKSAAYALLRDAFTDETE